MCHRFCGPEAKAKVIEAAMGEVNAFSEAHSAHECGRPVIPRSPVKAQNIIPPPFSDHPSKSFQQGAKSEVLNRVDLACLFPASLQGAGNLQGGCRAIASCSCGVKGRRRRRRRQAASGGPSAAAAAERAGSSQLLAYCLTACRRQQQSKLQSRAWLQSSLIMAFPSAC